MNIKEIANVNIIREIKNEQLINVYNDLLNEKEVVNRLIMEDEYVGYRYKIVDFLIEITESEMKLRGLKKNNKILIKKIS
jgi:hypothetical protein